VLALLLLGAAAGVKRRGGGRGRKGGREGGREEEAIKEEGFGFLEQGRDDAFVDWLARGRKGARTRWRWGWHGGGRRKGGRKRRRRAKEREWVFEGGLAGFFSAMSRGRGRGGGGGGGGGSGGGGGGGGRGGGDGRGGGGGRGIPTYDGKTEGVGELEGGKEGGRSVRAASYIPMSP
jgi:hypothetical protein